MGELHIIPHGIAPHSTLFVNIAKELLNEREEVLSIFYSSCDF